MEQRIKITLVAHPAPDYESHRRRAPQALQRRAQRARLEQHRGPLVDGVGHPDARAEDDFDWVRDRPGHDRRYAIDSSKLRRELGWRPARIDFAAGLAATVERYSA